MGDLVPRYKLWLESGDGLVMSDYRLRLLALIAETGSLAAAAAAMGLSYRRAWGKVKELEANLGYPLVRSEVGGAGGGHTALTPEGARLVEAYDRFRRRVDAAVQAAFAEELGPLAAEPRTTA
ncbi:LysR family transcriptional regulator [Tepidiforma flava]|uniref:LysR family transcriptional regulator n=1 Tax=Tepidiforma flava TaxID=3004094 RepID=A0ABY7M7K6_9CHLR|nr:LysR family transcriptional regulator [Tepidiforma flava]WBL36488.1 LysR family transcriptional regulator [Tepidiforma flava]